MQTHTIGIATAPISARTPWCPIGVTGGRLRRVAVTGIAPPFTMTGRCAS